MSNSVDNHYFKNLITLRFKDGLHEKKYLQSYHKRIAKVYLFMFVITTTLVLSFNLSDRISAPNSNPDYLLHIRLVMVLSCSLMLLSQLKAIRKYIDIFNSFMYFMVAFGLEFISVSYNPIDKVAYYGNYAGIILVIIGACNCLLIRFVPAFLASIALLISFLILAVIKHLDSMIIINVEVFLFSSCILGLYGTYQIEKLMRINYIREENLTKKTHELEDSIIYASYIQQALLSSREILDNCNFKNFIFFKPRDIVSGDFYWFKSIKNYLYFASADCTGHGVPGAFMSVLCISMLNDIVSKRDLNPPSVILNDIRKRLKKSLRQDQIDNMSHDGMDITLCLFDFESYTLQFAGAFNPVYIIRDNELIEYKVDRMPIGAYPKDNLEFKNHVVQLQENDMLYIFSDGYISQFGGPNNKKFGAKRFKEQLLNIHKNSLETQHQHLLDTFYDWKKSNDQIDDIQVLGVKI